MKKKLIGYFFLTIGILLVLSYLLYSKINFRVNESDIKCKDLIVEIDGKTKLLNEEEIIDMLSVHNLHPIGNSINNLKTDKIERFLKQNPFVKQSICFHTPEALVYLKVVLREPKFLVMTNEVYYVDSERIIMPVPAHAIAYVPVVTGRVAKTKATGPVFDFVDYIEKSTFWNAQIAQIHVRDDMKIELVPRVGNTIILLGKLVGYEEKLNRVFQLYSQVFKKIGWDRYKMLDLQYDNQIVGVKNENVKTIYR